MRKAISGAPFILIPHIAALMRATLLLAWRSRLISFIRAQVICPSGCSRSLQDPAALAHALEIPHPAE